ncbi:MAG: isocitrate lyase/PEP mutase family protein [Halioglobus sp.]|nr:isocitrate lyase/PEP mutase family protein [Halioglobus sp.]
MTDSTAKHTARLRHRLAQHTVLKAPGVYDALTALLVEQAGFDCAFVSGAGISFARYGRPDMGLVTASEVAATVAAMRERVDIPLIVDMDTGFGNALNAQRTLREFERAGASAVQMEDQTFPKRCGHMAGKGVIPAGEMVGKIHAVKDAREEEHTVVIARTDALAVNGFEDAVERGERYLEAGADVLFIEAPGSIEQINSIGEIFGQRIPLVYNLLEGGNSPISTASEVEAAGFRIALFPVALLHRAIPVMQNLLHTIATQGSTVDQHRDMLDITRINQLLGAPELLAGAKRYEGED